MSSNSNINITESHVKLSVHYLSYNVWQGTMDVNLQWRSAKAANDTTRAQINKIPEKSHVTPLSKKLFIKKLFKVAPYNFNSMYTWRRMKNQKWTISFTFVFKLLAFTVKISHTPGISSSLIWVCCRLLPWQQAILKIIIFWLFSTYLLPFLELASLKYRETRQSCENDFGQ